MKKSFILICFISMFIFVSCTGQKNKVINDTTQNKIVTYKIFKETSEKVIEDSEIVESLNEELNNIMKNTKDRAKSEVTIEDIDKLKTEGKVLEVSFSEFQTLNVPDDSKNTVDCIKLYLYKEQSNIDRYEFIIEDKDNILGLFYTNVDYIKIFKLI